MNFLEGYLVGAGIFNAILITFFLIIKFLEKRAIK